MKVSVVLEFDVTEIVADHGYLGYESATIKDHVHAALDEANRWKWLVDKKNGQPPEEVRMGVTVSRVIMEGIHE